MFTIWEFLLGSVIVMVIVSAGWVGYVHTLRQKINRRSDPHLVAYASLHEVVRRFLAGDANTKYLRKRHTDIEEDLQQAISAVRRDKSRIAEK